MFPILGRKCYCLFLDIARLHLHVVVDFLFVFIHNLPVLQSEQLLCVQVLFFEAREGLRYLCVSQLFLIGFETKRELVFFLYLYGA